MMFLYKFLNCSLISLKDARVWTEVKLVSRKRWGKLSLLCAS